MPKPRRSASFPSRSHKGMTMNRRAVLAALAVAPFVSRASAQAPIQLRISTAAVESDWLSRALVIFKERLAAPAPAPVHVQGHPNGALLPQATAVPAVERGHL